MINKTGKMNGVERTCAKRIVYISHLFWRIMMVVVLLFGASLACSLPTGRKATPTTTPTLIIPTAVPNTPTAPLPTPTPGPSEVEIQNGTISLTVQAQTKLIRLESPDGGDVSGLKASVFSLQAAILLIVKDPVGNYLSEYHLITEADPQNTIMLLKPTQYSPYSYYNVNAIDLSDLLAAKKGEVLLNALRDTLLSLDVPADFCLILAQPEPFSETQSMILYQTYLPDVLVALPADNQHQPVVKSALVLSIHDKPALPELVGLLLAQTQKISLANLTGLSMKDLADLQINAVNKLEKPDQAVAYFGNTPFEVKYNLKQVKEFTYYVNNVVIIDMPCGSHDMEGRIFAMYPPAGTEVVPKDARITLYRCEIVSEQVVKVVNLQIAPQAEACEFKPLNGLMDVALVIDVSGSMTGGGLASAKSAAIAFIKKLNQENAQVGLAKFESEAKVLSQLTNDFNSVIGLISGLSSGGMTAIDKGLMAGYSIVKASTRQGVPKAILLLSDGVSDEGAAIQAANEIKAAGVTILTVGVGDARQCLLSQIASSSREFAYSSTTQALKETFEAQALRLEYSGEPAARNVVVRFRFNAEAYALLEDVLDHDARIIGVDTIEWFFKETFPTQVIDLPVALRPLHADTDQPYGTLEVSYDQCKDGPKTSLPPQTITEATTQNITTTRLVIEYEQEKTGTLEEFQSASFLLDPNTPGVFSVNVQGAGSELLPEIYARDGKEKLYPLYSVWKSNDKKRISVFYIQEPKSYWLYLQSNSLGDAGNYQITIQRGEAIEPVPLDSGSAPFEDKVEVEEVRIYDLRGVKEGERFTLVLTVKGDSSDPYPVLVSLDGQTSYSFDMFYIWKDSTLTSVYQVQGEGPYRMIVDNTSGNKPLQYQMQIIPGDTLSTAMGSLVPGIQSEGKISALVAQTWTFEGKKNQGIDLSITIQNPREYINLIYTVYKPDGSIFLSGSVKDVYRSGWIQSNQEGTYTLVVLWSYSSGADIQYTLDLNQKEMPEATLREVKSGDTFQIPAINGRQEQYVVKISSGQELTVKVKLSTPKGYGTLYLIDPLGQISLSAVSFNGEITLGPIIIRYPGEYTLRVYTTTQEEATYEISVELN